MASLMRRFIWSSDHKRTARAAARAVFYDLRGV